MNSEAGMDHYITVGKLKELLADQILKDTDCLVPNAVANLAIYRDEEMIGWIDLLEDQQRVCVDEADSEETE